MIIILCINIRYLQVPTIELLFSKYHLKGNYRLLILELLTVIVALLSTYLLLMYITYYLIHNELPTR